MSILFIGDSITDCGRLSDAEGLGNGYVRLIRDYLLAKSPATAPRIINKGISGHKVTDLAARWKSDVIDQKPDVLSIMIGINDVWHALQPNPAGVAIEQFHQTYHALLRQVHAALPGCQLVLCEPTIIDSPAPAEGNAKLQPYVRAVREISREFTTSAAVPTHQAFIAARKQRPDVAWAPDGVHPSGTGHMLIARTWLEAVGLI